MNGILELAKRMGTTHKQVHGDVRDSGLPSHMWPTIRINAIIQEHRSSMELISATEGRVEMRCKNCGYEMVRTRIRETSNTCCPKCQRVHRRDGALTVENHLKEQGSFLRLVKYTPERAEGSIKFECTNCGHKMERRQVFSGVNITCEMCQRDHKPSEKGNKKFVRLKAEQCSSMELVEFKNPKPRIGQKGYFKLKCSRCGCTRELQSIRNRTDVRCKKCDI